MAHREPTHSPLAHEDLLAHGDALLRFALPRVGELETAEDLVQDTLVTAVSNLENFSGDSSLRTWLIGILRHKILDHYRWKQRHPGDQPVSIGNEDTEQDPWFTSLGVWREDPNAGLEVLDADPARALERTQLRAVLRRCIARLPERLRHVFVLRELEDLDPDATCEAAGIKRGSLPVLLYRARQTLRACLQKQWVRS